jgi:hypothetical protein
LQRCTPSQLVHDLRALPMSKLLASASSTPASHPPTPPPTAHLLRNYFHVKVMSSVVLPLSGLFMLFSGFALKRERVLWDFFLLMRNPRRFLVRCGGDKEACSAHLSARVRVIFRGPGASCARNENFRVVNFSPLLDRQSHPRVPYHLCTFPGA